MTHRKVPLGKSECTFRLYNMLLLLTWSDSPVFLMSMFSRSSVCKNMIGVVRKNSTKSRSPLMQIALVHHFQSGTERFSLGNIHCSHRSIKMMRNAWSLKVRYKALKTNFSQQFETITHVTLIPDKNKTMHTVY